MDEDLHWRIVTFFDYWRKRHSFICSLDFLKHDHEANILIWASLDALSNLWAKNIGKERCNKKGKRLVFDAFLARYGGDVFQIVSLPDVWNRIDRGDIEKTKFPIDVCQELARIGGRQTPTFLNERQLRHSSDDLNMCAIVAAISQNRPDIDHLELENWLILSRYGAIAYKKMRSAYIHEGRSGACTHGFDLYESIIRPTYLSGIYTTPPILGFKVEFMSNVLGDCINAFESDALALHQDPAP